MGIETWADDHQWYVVHTHPKQEERANENLRSWGVETLHAKLRTSRYNEFTGAPTYITQSLFPRYIFAKFNAREQLPQIRFTRGVNNVVCFGEGPAPVDQDVIDVIRGRSDEHGFVRANDELKPGDNVVIRAGPLRDLIGIFEREIKGSDRVMILLTAIEYQARLVVKTDLVQRASAR
jgi:transcriptional antiterminator RfaH